MSRRKKNKGAYCESHADAVVNDALAMLPAVGVTMAELMEYYKDWSDVPEGPSLLFSRQGRCS
ncbi:MAG: hypothetical protein IMZ69_11035 [Spirochaetes bacterium]|nr:hypothetical protein [Spirochaetota bacterium]